MTRRLILSTMVMAGLVACNDTPTTSTPEVSAPDFIINGTPDGSAHPYVGLLLFFGEVDGEEVAWICTGSLLDENTVLTAGHCTSGADEVRFFPGEKPLDAQTATVNWWETGYISGKAVTYPGWDEFASFPNTGDVGVVQLKRSLPGPYAQLAPVNGLDLLAKHQAFTVVGYGLEGVRPVEVQNIERMTAEVKLLQLQSGRGFFGPYNLKLSSNGSGATCFGDSGGPILVGNVVYAVNSYVWNSNCTNASYAFRVDLVKVHEWILKQL